jgi:hypothetical protein
MPLFKSASSYLKCENANFEVKISFPEKAKLNSNIQGTVFVWYLSKYGVNKMSQV